MTGFKLTFASLLIVSGLLACSTTRNGAVQSQEVKLSADQVLAHFESHKWYLDSFVQVYPHDSSISVIVLPDSLVILEGGKAKHMHMVTTLVNDEWRSGFGSDTFDYRAQGDSLYFDYGLDFQYLDWTYEGDSTENGQLSFSNEEELRPWIEAYKYSIIDSARFSISIKAPGAIHTDIQYYSAEE